MAIQGVIGAIVSAAARNMQETGKSRRQATSGYNIDAVKKQQPGMQYQQMPAMQSGATSPTGQISQFATGMPIQQQKMVPVIGSALKGEEEMLKNQEIPMVGGYMLQPKFDSSRPIYSSRRMF